MGQLSQEIDDLQKEHFTEVIDGLRPLLIPSEPLIQLFADTKGIFKGDAVNEDQPIEEIEIVSTQSYKGYFEIFGVQIEIETAEDYYGDGYLMRRSYNVQTTRVVKLGDLTLEATAVHIIDWKEDILDWKLFYEGEDQLYSPDSAPLVLPSERQIDYGLFMATKPSNLEIRAYYAAIKEEKAASGSDEDPEFRFTPARLHRVLPLLEQLGPEHVTLPLES